MLCHGTVTFQIMADIPDVGQLGKPIARLDLDFVQALTHCIREDVNLVACKFNGWARTDAVLVGQGSKVKLGHFDRLVAFDSSTWLPARLLYFWLPIALVEGPGPIAGVVIRNKADRDTFCATVKHAIDVAHMLQEGDVVNPLPVADLFIP